MARRDNTLQALRLLVALRVFTPLAQAATLLVAVTRFDVQVALPPVLVLIGIEIALAAATWLRLRLWPRIGVAELFVQVHVDIALFTAMLYLTGGATNPFAPLFLLPTLLTGAALPPMLVWVTAASTMGAYVFLRRHHLDLLHPQGWTQVYELHEDGMVVNYVLTAALLTFVCLRTVAALNRTERLLADARDAQMRNDSVVSIGALAAGHAHELGSPLTTMALVVDELKRERVGDVALVRELNILETELDNCKKIVSRLVEAAGRRRAESVSGAGVDAFARAIVDRARTLHPEATIALTVAGREPAPRVAIDETLRQAVTNLVDNALAVSPCSVAVHAEWDPRRLVFTVRDKGPGFPAELLRRVGEPLASAKGAGPGVGLMLTAATLERLGGSLELSNPADGGACAVARVPLAAILL